MQMNSFEKRKERKREIYVRPADSITLLIIHSAKLAFFFVTRCVVVFYTLGDDICFVLFCFFYTRVLLCIY